jgi:hypothetical protein
MTRTCEWCDESIPFLDSQTTSGNSAWHDSRRANLKELRFAAADGVWRVAFAFDPKRTAILLVAGDKSGVSEKRFYRQLIDTARVLTPIWPRSNGRRKRKGSHAP